MENLNSILQELYNKRTSADLEQYVLAMYELMKVNIEIRKLSRAKVGLFKQYWEELVPLYRYSKSRFAIENAIYYLVEGNQNYDAIEESADKIQNIEFTEFYNGHKYHKDMLLLNEKGLSEIEIGNPEIEKRKFIDLFENHIEKKKTKGYKDTVIIFMASYHKQNFLFENQIEEFTNELVAILKTKCFENNRILFMYKVQEISDDADAFLYEV